MGYRFGESQLFGGIDGTGDFRASSGRLSLDEGAPPVHFPDGEVLREGYLSLTRMAGWNSLTFGFDAADATPERIAFFEALAESIGAELNSNEGGAEEYPEWWKGEAFTLEVLPSGELELVACE